MNARERCRARRLERRQNEREILAATGAVIRSAIPVALYNAGHRKSQQRDGEVTIRLHADKV